MTDPFELLRSELLDAAARVEAVGPPPLRRPRTRWRPLVVLVAALVISGSAAAGVISLSSSPSQPLSGRIPGRAAAPTSGVPASLAGYRYAIHVVPSLPAGSAGWEVWTDFAAPRSAPGLGGGGGGGYPTAGVPIFQGSGTMETGASSDTPPRGDRVIFVLTGPQVAAVRAGARTIRTFASPLLPAGDRAAVFFEPARGPQVTLIWRPGQPIHSSAMEPDFSSLGRGGQPPLVRVRTLAVIALDDAGRALANGLPNPGGIEYQFWQSPRALTPQISEPPYHGPTRPARGACELGARGLSALIPAWGATIARVTPVRDALGGLFLSCVSTEYYLHNWPLVGAVLLDARRPGAAPGTIPGAEPIAGHPGVVGYGAASLTARRVGNAWLVVRGGSGLAQRLQVLDALRITRLALAPH